MLSSIRRIAVAALGVAAAGALLASPVLADDDDKDDRPSGGSTSPATNGTETTKQSTFVSPDKSVAFGFHVQGTAGEEYEFTIRVPIGVSWGAIGLGSHNMKNALVFMIYMNEAGDNVTFSPRLSHGDYEPVYTPDFKYTVLPGTGLFDDHMVFSARCTEECQNWSDGWLDVSSPNEEGIYAVGPVEGFSSNDPAASIRYHERYGSFTIDMRQTFGNASPPVLNDQSTNAGSVLHEDEDGKFDKKSIFHAVVMILVYIGLMPLGVVLLRVGHWVRWHAVNQGIALIGVFGGLWLGIATSLYYQRTRKFNTPHQIIGLLLVAFGIAQFVLGFLHHREYKKTQQTTKMAPVHVWLGRVIIILATVNAFLGFPLAMKPNRNYILAGVVILVFLGTSFLLFGRSLLDRLRGKKGSAKPNGRTQGYDPEPWRHTDTHGGTGYGGHAVYSPGQPPQQIGLVDVGSPRNNRRSDRDLGGAEQKPAEFA